MFAFISNGGGDDIDKYRVIQEDSCAATGPNAFRTSWGHRSQPHRSSKVTISDVSRPLLIIDRSGSPTVKAIAGAGEPFSSLSREGP